MKEEVNPKAVKVERMKKLLSCSRCPPHRAENRRKVCRHKTRKNRNYQFVIKK